MQIEIELDKEDYEKIKKTYFVEDTKTIFNQSSEDRKGMMMLFRVIDAIKNGTPVQNAHWVLYRDHRNMIDYLQCDSCGAVIKLPLPIDNLNFCPNCGRKIEEAESEDKGMNKDEAIQELKSDIEWSKLNRYPYISQRKVEALQMAIKALEQEPILDKIRTEIIHLHDWAFDREGILKIIDKYRTESEET